MPNLRSVAVRVMLTQNRPGPFEDPAWRDVGYVDEFARPGDPQSPAGPADRPTKLRVMFGRQVRISRHRLTVRVRMRAARHQYLRRLRARRGRY